MPAILPPFRGAHRLKEILGASKSVDRLQCPLATCIALEIFDRSTITFLNLYAVLGVRLSSVTATYVPELLPSRRTLRYHRDLVDGIVATPGSANVALAGTSIVTGLKDSILSTTLAIAFGFTVAHLVVRTRPRPGCLILVGNGGGSVCTALPLYRFWPG